MKNLFRRKELPSLPEPQETMGDLIAKQFHGQALRIVRVDGVPYFVAKDVCEILGIKNNRDAVNELDSDEKNTVVLTDGNRGNPNVTGITESGLYALIFKSRKETAKEFRKWVTSEVLPSIRESGGYVERGSLPPELSRVLDGQQQILEHVGQLAASVAALAQEVVSLKQQPVAPAAPILSLPDGGCESQDMFDMVRAVYIRLLRSGEERVELRFPELAEICHQHTIFPRFLSLDLAGRPTPRMRSFLGMALKNQFDNKLIKMDGELVHTRILGRHRSRRYLVARVASPGGDP